MKRNYLTHDWCPITDSETPQQWLATEVIGFCNCGNPEEVANLLFSVLKDVAAHNIDIKRLDMAYELALKILDKAALTEHGTSVWGSWLTPHGQDACKICGIPFRE